MTSGVLGQWPYSNVRFLLLALHVKLGHPGLYLTLIAELVFHLLLYDFTMQQSV